MSLADFPELLKLSPEEKRQLAEELYERAVSELPEPPLSAEERRILEERIAEHDADPGSALSLEEFWERFEALRKTRVHA